MLPSYTIDNALNYFEALFTKTKQNSVLLMNTDGIIIRVNDHFLESFGYTRNEIIGINNATFFTPEDKANYLPEKELMEVTKHGQSFDNNYLVSKDGTRTWVAGESILVKLNEEEFGILKIIQNIHEQKLSEAALQNLHEFNENILTTIEDVVLVLDKEMKIIKTNRPLEGIFKIIEKGKPVDFKEAIKPYDTNNEILEKIKSCKVNPPSFYKSVIEIENNEDEKKIYDIVCSPLDADNNNGHVLIVIHDITEQKKAEREREDIIGFVAHELRNPLANIVLCNEILHEAILQNNIPEMYEMLQRSKNNVMRLNKMISELYDATKASAGNFSLDIESFNLQDMIKEAIDTVKVLQPYYNIIVRGDGNVIAMGDKYRLIQVVINFLSNGIKYSNGSTDVILTLKHDSENITVSVEDQGLGISKSQLPYIFERFFRAERTRNLEGIGLGLFLCRQIIVAHKGKIWAESEEGKGSTFYFSIPLALQNNL